MPVVASDVVLVAAASAGLILALCAALVLVLVGRRRPAQTPLAIAAVLLVLGLVTVAVVPVTVPLAVGLVLALLGTVVAVVGGDPVTRRILDIATHGQVRDGDAGGILVFRARAGDGDTEGGVEEVLRGGTTIGYLERLAIVVSLIAGFPETVAVVVAVKGIGRFSELATAAARERFIVGTLSSLLWAGLVGALVRLSIG